MKQLTIFSYSTSFGFWSSQREIDCLTLNVDGACVSGFGSDFEEIASYSPGWLLLSYPPVSTSQVLGLQAHTIKTQLCLNINWTIFS